MDISISHRKPFPKKKSPYYCCISQYILIIVEMFFHGSAYSHKLEDLTSFTVCWHLSYMKLLSHISMDYHLLKDTMINDPCLVTPKLTIDSTDCDLPIDIMTNDPRLVSVELSNHHCLDKSLPSIESTKSLSTLNPPCLHFLHVRLISQYFRLDSQSIQRDHHNNTTVLNQNIQQKWKKKIENGMRK